MDLIFYIAGTLIIVVAIVDVFVTILYARSGTGLLSPWINLAVWHVFRTMARAFGTRKNVILSFCGPTLFVVLMGIWVFLFISGFSLIIWPQLGDQVKATSGPTSTDFWNAFYYSGYSFSTLGTGDIVPKNHLYRGVMILQSIMGFSFFTLVITYILNVYNALHRRNTFALSLHSKTIGTADPSEYIIRLASDTELIFAQEQFTSISTEFSDLLESHHFYPILHYFRFLEVQYGIPRILLIAMDSLSLFKSTLDEDRYFNQVNGAAVDEAWNSGMTLMTFFSESILPAPRFDNLPDTSEMHDKWRVHYFHTLKKLQDRGIETAADPEEGFRRYINYRNQWDAYVLKFSQIMLFDKQELMPFQE